MDASPIVCPSCARANPPDAKGCHYCAASLRERISARWLTLGAVLLLVIGAIHFWLAVSYNPPYVAVADLTDDMNFDRVRVLGHVANVSVVRKPYGGKMIRMDLQDATAPDKLVSRSKITVKIEGEGAKDYLQQKQMLRPGDLVDVAGILYSGDGYRSLNVSGPKFILRKREIKIPRGDDRAVVRVESASSGEQ